MLGSVGTKRGIAAEESVGDDDCAERDELVFYLCMHGEAIILVG